MSFLDDLTKVVADALSAGATTARAQGTALKGDFEKLVMGQLEDICAQVASITSDFAVGDISKEQAQDDLTTQSHRIKPIVLGEAELAFLAVQAIIDAVADALKSAVNTAVGVALL